MYDNSAIAPESTYDQTDGDTSQKTFPNFERVYFCKSGSLGWHPINFDKLLVTQRATPWQQIRMFQTLRKGRQTPKPGGAPKKRNKYKRKNNTTLQNAGDDKVVWFTLTHRFAYGKELFPLGKYMVILDVDFGPFFHYYLVSRSGLNGLLGCLNPPIDSFTVESTGLVEKQEKVTNLLQHLQLEKTPELLGRVRLPLVRLFFAGMDKKYHAEEVRACHPPFWMMKEEVTVEVVCETCAAIFRLEGKESPFGEIDK